MGAGAMAAIRVAFVAYSLISALFFRKPQQPQGIQNLQFQTTSRGAPLPILYGTRVTAGNIIWASPFSIHNPGVKGGGKGSAGGKGGNQTTYSASFAIALCEGPVDGILNVWEDKTKLDLSKHPEIVIYKGTKGQPVDPTISSYKGGGVFSPGQLNRNESFAGSISALTTYQLQYAPIRTGSMSVYYLKPQGSGAMQYVVMTEVSGSPGPNQYTMGSSHEVFDANGVDLLYQDYSGSVITIGHTDIDGAIVYVNYIQDVQGGNTTAVYSNAPSYPYTCYVVFTNEDLGTQPRIKNYRFEVVRSVVANAVSPAAMANTQGLGTIGDVYTMNDGQTWTFSTADPHPGFPLTCRTDKIFYQCYTSQPGGGGTQFFVQLYESTDGGQTWHTYGNQLALPYTDANNYETPIGGAAPVSNGFLLLSDGSFVFAAQRHGNNGSGTYNTRDNFWYRSTDGGTTWTKGMGTGAYPPDTSQGFDWQWAATCKEDQTRPGYIYGFGMGGFYDYYFLKSTDYGRTWSVSTHLGGNGVPGAWTAYGYFGYGTNVTLVVTGKGTILCSRHE